MKKITFDNPRKLNLVAAVWSDISPNFNQFLIIFFVMIISLPFYASFTLAIPVVLKLVLPLES